MSLKLLPVVWLWTHNLILPGILTTYLCLLGGKKGWEPDPKVNTVMGVPVNGTQVNLPSRKVLQVHNRVQYISQRMQSSLTGCNACLKDLFAQHSKYYSHQLRDHLSKASSRSFQHTHASVTMMLIMCTQFSLQSLRVDLICF